MLRKLSDYLRSDLWRSLLVILFILQYSNFYRVVLRCILEGEEFEWMNTWGVSLLGNERAMRLMGNGLEGHFLIQFLMAVLFMSVLFGLMRRQNDILAISISLLFTGVLAVKEMMLSLAYGDQYVIAGETFRLNLNYEIIGPALSVMIFALVLFLAFKSDKPIRQERSVNPKIALGSILLLIPSAILLKSGDQHDWTDMAGVSLIYIQLILIVLSWAGIFSGKSE